MSRRGLLRSAVFFPVFFTVTFVAGIHLKAVGMDGIAVVLWVPVNGFAAFIAVQEVAWDAWELVFERFGADAGEEEGDAEGGGGPDRDLRMDFALSTTFKTVTAVVLTMGVVAGLGFVAWRSLPVGAHLRTVVPEVVAWYQANVLPHWPSVAT